MTVPVQFPFISHTASGVSAVFAYDFLVIKKDDFLVTINGAALTQADFAVTGLGQDNGGTITISAGAPVEGAVVIIRRAVALSREIDYQQSGDFLATTVNSDFDRIWQALQDGQIDSKSAIKYPAIENLDGTLPAAGSRVGMLLGFDALGAAVMTPPAAAIGAGDLIYNTFTSGVDYTEGVSTTFTLSRAPGAAGNLEIYFMDSFQGPDQWSVTGTTLTFTSPIPVGVTQVFARIGTTLSLEIPPDGSVTDAKVATNAAINSSKLSYLLSATGAVARTVKDKLSDTVSIRDFYNPADGANWVPSYNRAVAYANSRTTVGTTIFFPDGQYDLTAGGLSAITVAEVSLVGASSSGSCLILPSGQAAIQFGDGGSGLSVGGGMQRMKLKYTGTPAVGSIVFRFEYVSRLHFDDLLLENIRTLASCGVSAARFASAIYISNARGYVYNGGSPLYDLRFGAGLFLMQNSIFVGGVLAPVDPNPMTTVANTNVLNAVTGSWDTVQAVNCIWERFDGGIVGIAGSGVAIQNFYFANCIFDYFKTNVVNLNSTVGGVVGTFQMQNCWFVSWEAETIVISTVGGYNDDHMFSGKVVIAGKEAVLYSVPGARRSKFDLEVGAVNRVGTATAAMNFSATSTGFIVVGCRGNDDNTGVGLPWRAAYGILVGADCDFFVVSDNRMSGSTGGYNIANNASGSTNRRVSNNASANYAGIGQGFALPASGNTFTNTRSYPIDCFVFGGTVSSISVKGVGIPNMTNGSFRLDPGETFTPTYSVAPAFTQISVA